MRSSTYGEHHNELLNELIFPNNQFHFTPNASILHVIFSSNNRRSKCKATRLDKTKPKKWQWWNTISYVSRKNTCEGGDAHFGDIYKKPQKCKKF